MHFDESNHVLLKQGSDSIFTPVALHFKFQANITRGCGGLFRSQNVQRFQFYHRGL